MHASFFDAKVILIKWHTHSDLQCVRLVSPPRLLLDILLTDITELNLFQNSIIMNKRLAT